MKNNIIRGVRKASDFLMALQLTGAFKEEALANLQVELPAVVIGGGLTAIDTATELLAYYPLQAEKTLARYEALCAEKGEDAVRATFDPEERDILDRLLAHGLAVRKERERAHAAGETPRPRPPLPRSGAACRSPTAGRWRTPPPTASTTRRSSRRSRRASPSSRASSREEAVAGRVRQAEGRCGSCAAARARSSSCPRARCLVAAGTTPNITYAKEFPDAFPLDAEAALLRPAPRRALGRRLSPGTGATRGRDRLLHRLLARRQVRHLLRRQPPRLQRQRRQGDGLGPQRLPGDRRGARRPSGDRGPAGRGVGRVPRRGSSDDLTAEVVAVNRLTPTIIEVVVRAPAAARNFQPGQFFRLQNLESRAPRVGRIAAAHRALRADGRLGRPGEGPALDDRPRDRRLDPPLLGAPKPGEPVVAMGPTGTATELPENSTVMLLRRRPRQRGALLDRQEGPGARQPGHLLRRLQEGRGLLQARGARGGRGRARPLGRPGRGHPGAPRLRTAASSATSSRRWSPTRRDGWAKSRSRSRPSSASSSSARIA